MAHMLRHSLLALAALFALALLVLALPAPGGAAAQGVRLSQVSLRLYPAQDEAEWRFDVPELVFDPLSGDARIVGVRRGERWVGEPGAERLDLTIAADALTIDAQDNLRAGEATLYILQDCMTVALAGDPQTPVRIDQHQGYSAPHARVTSPTIRGQFRDLSAAFDLSRFEGEQLPGSQFDAASEQECLEGRIVPRTP